MASLSTESEVPVSTPPLAAGIAAIKHEFVLKRTRQDTSEDGRQRKKVRGQNKHRPRSTKQDPHHRLCRSTVRGSQCTAIPNCRFLHSVDEYLANKPADLGDKCIFFERDGECPYGVTCRFMKGHIRVEREDETVREKPPTSDFKLLYSQLRKRQVKLPRSEKYLETMDVGGKKIESADDKVELPESGATADGAQGYSTVFSAVEIREERKTIDFRGKLYLAPLTTVGNFPFRRICSEYGADITCGEMAMATSLMQGLQQEWSLIDKRSLSNWQGNSVLSSSSIVGAQLCGSYPDTMTRCAEVIGTYSDVDFVDVNLGCPIELVCNKGGGAALMGRPTRLGSIIRGMRSVLDIPLTVKIRTGLEEGKPSAHKLIPLLKEWGVDAITLHGRSRAQRYTKLADWDYITECARIADPVPLIGCGDILSHEDYYRCLETGVSGCMIARGALMKPWIFTEIKERKVWDISSQERFQMLQHYTNYGFERWGSDTEGVEKTRRFLLEWLSFLYRYIPVGLLERVPQKMNERPPQFQGRDDLETLMASNNSADWVKLSTMLLGPPPDNFLFLPKHKANSYSV